MPQRPRLIPAHAGKTLRSCHRARRWPAHPRSRGENKRPASDSSSRVGSSPLTRGKLPFGCRREPFSRLIPAHAGKTVPTAWKALPRPAHPRSRGENPGPVELSTKKTRLIPAHAGKTLKTRTVGRPWQAHPRSRGENRVLWELLLVLSGSSPLTRGKPRRLRQNHGDRLAHPRSRGENCGLAVRDLRQCGSSPLTRGKPVRGGTRQPHARLIPAHAGKTNPSCQVVCGRGAHPRSRGENAPHHDR